MKVGSGITLTIETFDLMKSQRHKSFSSGICAFLHQIIINLSNSCQDITLPHKSAFILAVMEKLESSVS